MKKRCFSLLLILILLTGPACACAAPDLTLQDTSLRSGSWAEVYSQILTEHSAGIDAYQDYVARITSIPSCRAVGLTDLTGDGIPELLFMDLVHEDEYGFDVGRFWIYSSDGQDIHCALTLQPEIDDMLFSRYYLAKNGLLTLYFSDCEMSWIMRLRPDLKGRYAAKNTLIEQADFSGEGPDVYLLNNKKISLKKYQSLTAQFEADRGTEIGNLSPDDGGRGFTHTLAEAQAALSSGEAWSSP